MPFIGPLDRRIVFEKKTITQDELGQPVETWAFHKAAWANRRDMTANERFRSQQELAERTSVFTVRYFAALTAGEWRISHESLIWDIVGFAEPKNTRRQWWEITATAVRV